MLQVINFYVPSFQPFSFLLWIIVLPILSYLLNRYGSNRKRGVVTPIGLKKYNQNTEIAFDTIESITGAQGGQNIFTANASVEIYLPKQEIVKLSKTLLNSWIINNHSISILPAMPGKLLTITYSPVGKYTFNFITMLYILFAIEILFVRSAYLIMPILGMGIFFILQKYSQITVRIHDGGVSIIEKSNEVFISFSDIQTVKKKMFYIRIYTKDKKSFILPKQCLYLYDLLEYSSNNTYL